MRVPIRSSRTSLRAGPCSRARARRQPRRPVAAPDDLCRQTRRSTNVAGDVGDGTANQLDTLIYGWRVLVARQDRMAAEALLPPRPPAEGDESISSFVRRRFGDEAVKDVAEPLLAGLHRGDAARFSLRALFPVLADAERWHGRVARAWRTMPPAAGAGGSMSLRRGLAALPSAMSAALPQGVAVTGAHVVAIERSEEGFRVHARDHATLTARTVVLATPAHVTCTLTAKLDDELAALCGGIRYVPVVNVAVSYPRDAVRYSLHGWGFVVPATRDAVCDRSAGSL